MAQGRVFSRDFPTDAKTAFILNETAARQLGWENPIGKKFAKRDRQAGTVIGIVKDFHFSSLHTSIEPLILFVFSFLDQDFDHWYKQERRLGQLFGYFALLAIVIAVLGLLGLASFTAEQRRKEISIRKVLGASVVSVVLLLMEDITKLVLVAVVLAVPVAYFAMSRWLSDFAYRIDWGIDTFVLAGILLLGTATLTVGYQSIKAALTNPVEALRHK